MTTMEIVSVVSVVVMYLVTLLLFLTSPSFRAVHKMSFAYWGKRYTILWWLLGVIQFGIMYYFQWHIAIICFSVLPIMSIIVSIYGLKKFKLI